MLLHSLDFWLLAELRQTLCRCGSLVFDVFAGSKLFRLSIDVQVELSTTYTTVVEK